jgi:hypothetical protein
VENRVETVRCLWKKCGSPSLFQCFQRLKFRALWISAGSGLAGLPWWVDPGEKDSAKFSAERKILGKNEYSPALIEPGREVALVSHSWLQLIGCIGGIDASPRWQRSEITPDAGR